MTWQLILGELLGKFIIPELLEYTKRRFEETGNWPTKEELQDRISTRANVVIDEADLILLRLSLEKKEE